MKRLNPDTGEPFKRGDMRDDGKVFFVYSATVGKNGFKGERWITVSELDEIRALHRSKWTDAKSELKRQSRKKIKSLNPKKRLNPVTGKPFRSGDKDQNSSLVFLHYYTDVSNDGYAGEKWVSIRKYETRLKQKRLHKKQFLLNASLRDKLKVSIHNAKGRARKKKLEFSVTTEYLLSLYPDDELCPVFKIKMVQGGNRQNSPSIDRIDNSKGYIEGNVVWMSYRANFVKSNSEQKEIIALANWFKGLTE
jgi:hypothetical protein